MFQPSLDLEMQAITYYLNFYLSPTENGPRLSRGVADSVRPLWISRTQNTVLDLAVSSLALAVFSRTQRYPPASLKAASKYHQLLQRFQGFIFSLSGSNVDICLLIIFLMSRYEDVVHHPGSGSPLSRRLRSFSHHDGALATLKLWFNQFSFYQPATDVIKFTRRGLIRSALLRSHALPDWILDGAIFGERNFELKYDQIILQFASLRNRLSLIQVDDFTSTRSKDISSTINGLVQEAQDIDRALQEWTCSFPNVWNPQRHILSEPHPWPLRDFYSRTVYTYSDAGVAATWNQYYATRMLVDSARLRLLRISESVSGHLVREQQIECFHIFECMANDLASSIPFCLQRFKVLDDKSISLSMGLEIKPDQATLVIWPLSIASSLEDLNIKHTTWFRSELARLGRIAGVGMLEGAETERWLRL
ncbi:hypothetical protein ACLMJK_003879 [Lecanora helva]